MSRKDYIKDYIVNMSHGYLEVNDTLYAMRNFEDFSNFLETEGYQYLYRQTIEKLSRKRNFDFHVGDFFNSMGYDLSNIKIPDLLNPFDKILFFKIMGDFEREVGNILLKSFHSYEDIMDFRYIFKKITDRYYDIGMPNFTYHQHKSTEIIKETFEENLDNFKHFLNVWKEHNKESEKLK